MGEYTYKIPDNFQQGFVSFLDINGKTWLAQIFMKCSISYKNVGYAYYAGIKNAPWDTYALDFTIESTKNNIENIKRYKKLVAENLQKYLKNDSGYLVRDVDYLISENEIEIMLPENNEEDFATLSRDIADALAKKEPVLVLDRLHTYSTKYIREICQKHGIPISAPDGQFYPIHSLVGSLVKYYEQNNIVDSDFSKMAMKMSISLFDSYNSIRNDKSYAHDNALLDKKEAAYVVQVLSATLTFIHEIENY